MKKLLHIKSSLVLSFICLSALLNAQVFEAESGTPANGASIQTDNSASGNQVVSLQGGSWSLNINLSESAFYDLYIVASSTSYKENNIVINGSSASFSVDNAAYESIKVASFAKLKAGDNLLEITNSWGWINFDYIELVEVDASTRFDIETELVSPNPTPEVLKLYQFLLDNYGKKIISGAMTLNSFDDSDWLKENTGKEPALLGIDFMQTNRGYNWYNDKTPANDARTWYNKNGIPALMWHWRDPSRTTEEFYTEKTDFDANSIFNVGTDNYNAIISDIDFVANQLKTLQNDGVPVIWRPLHEAAGGWFWWGAKGPAACKQLWTVMYDRMVNHHGLNNLIWVWTREPDDSEWYPGDEYVDIVGRDIYKDGDHTSQILEFNNMNALYNGKKMLAISESGSFPDVDNLQEDAASWSWYMPWYGKYARTDEYNSLELWKKMFASEYVITLDEMPNLKTYETSITGIEKETQQASSIYPTFAEQTVTITSQNIIETIQVFNTYGQVVEDKKISNKEEILNVENYQSGTYIVLINQNERHKFVIK